MSHHGPRTLIKSREVLQSLKGGQEIIKYEIFDRLLQKICGDVINEASRGNTKYIFKIDKNQHMRTIGHVQISINTILFITDFIEVLKKEYIDCKIEYSETKGYEGKVIEQIIVIDWS